MEELYRRRGSFIVQSPNGSFTVDPGIATSPQPSNKTSHSRQNSLRVAVQHRRASIISINKDNLLEVGIGQSRSRSGSVRSINKDNLLELGNRKARSRSGSVRSSSLLVIHRFKGRCLNPDCQPPTPMAVVEAGLTENGRRKSFVGSTHGSRRGSFKNR